MELLGFILFDKPINEEEEIKYLKKYLHLLI